MEKINKVISWYQSKIGTYDKQLWEMSAEKKVIKSLHNIPRKTANLKSGLIDVDLIRGSAFSKAKPSHGWSTIARVALFRILFFPFYYKWWIVQTSYTFFSLMLILYISQIISSIIYITSWDDFIMDQVPFSEMISPVVLMVVLGIMHGQMVSTHHSTNKAKKFVDKKKRKTKTRRNRSSNRSTSKQTSANEDSSVKEINENAKSSLNRVNGEDDGGSSSDSSVCNENEKRKQTSKERLLSKTFLNGVPRSEINPVSPSQHQTCVHCSKPYTDSANGDVQGVTNDNSTLTDSVIKSNEIQENDAVENSNENTGLPETSQTLTRPQTLELDCLKKVQSSSEDTGTDSYEVIGSDPIIYKPLNEEDSVEANEYEDVTVLNQPIEEMAGELLLSTDLVEGLCDTQVSGACVPNTEANLLDDDAHYIPSDTTQMEGNLNLLGIKKRCSIGRLHIRHQSTETVDNLPDSDYSEIPAVTVPVPDPIITINDLTASPSTTPNSELDETLQKTMKDLSGSKEISRNPNYGYIPSSDQEQQAGKIDLVGIKKRYQVGMFLRQRKKSSTKVEGSSCRGRTVPKTFCTRGVEIKDSPLVSSCESGTESTVPQTPTAHKGTLSELEYEDRMRSSEIASSDTSSFSSGEETEQQSGVEDPFNHNTHNHHSHHVGVIPSASDSVSCVIWESGDAKKVDLSVIDIGWHIIDKVDKIPEVSDYVLLGIVFSMMVFLLPVCFKVYHARGVLDVSTPTGIRDGAETVFGSSWRILLVGGNVLFQRLFLSLILFFLLSVTERTFKQRLLYAKNFCYLTSSRKAKKYDLPHFRLNKVRNIKTWLSLRSYLKKKGPQRSVNTVVSAAFLLAITLASLVCLQLLKDSEHFLQYFYNWELLLWCLCLGTYLLRFMTLGTKINKKYRNLSVLITEQINLYLHMEQKPHKKEELMLANSVLKLAEDLLKELESPFKMAGLSVNPFIYNFTKVVILSAISAVGSELLGFKLKLYKLKVKA